MSDAEAPDDRVHRTLETVWRMEAARIIAALTRVTGDIGLAEDAAQDAFEAALRQWPERGVPEKPAAWLSRTARHKAIDTVRRRAALERKSAELGMAAAPADEPDLDPDEGIAIEDDLLRLMFICCHPVLSVDVRVSLTLRVVGGLRTEEIARAFLAKPSAIGQRISRAKRTLREARVPFEVPTGRDFDERLGSVATVIYLVFNEGYAATGGDDWMRPALAEDALRLGRMLAALVPDEGEVHGLVALMELQASRMAARTDPTSGDPIPLLEQDRSRWDGLLIERGLAALERADALSGGRGPYTLQAAIAACHARAHRPDETDWARIVALYDALAALTPSPVIELNRAVAVSMVDGPAAGLELLEPLRDEPSMATYHLLPAVRGDLLSKLGRHGEAGAELARAAAIAQNEQERELLSERAAAARERAEA